MSKVLKAKRWLVLQEAAKHLSSALSEEVAVADVLQLGLERHLGLSARFVKSCQVQAFVEVQPDEIQYEAIPSLVPGRPDLAIPVGGEIWTDELGQIRQKRERVVWLEPQIFDLPMLWAERSDVERAYQREIGGIEVAEAVGEGVLLQSLDGRYFSLVERWRERDSSRTKDPWLFNDPDDFQPAARLPQHCRIVVRPSSLEAFLRRSIGSDNKPTTLGERERTNLLNTIGALLADSGKKESAIISSILERHRDVPGLKERTLQERFAEAKRSLRAS